MEIGWDDCILPRHQPLDEEARGDGVAIPELTLARQADRAAPLGRELPGRHNSLGLKQSRRRWSVFIPTPKNAYPVSKSC